MKTKIYQIQSIHKLQINDGHVKFFYARLLSALFFFLMIGTSVQAQTTLNPVADTDTHSDVAAGTNTLLNASQWTHLFIRFDLASISSSVTGATLRIYQTTNSGAYTLNINTTSTDSWNEGATKPTLGTLITSGAGRTTAGYIDINLTPHVQTKMGGNKIVSVALTTNLGTWTTFSSRQSSTNKPQLVITTGTASNLTVSPATLNFGSAAGSSNVSVTSNVSWTVSDNQTWITTSPASGSNNGTVAVSVTANAGSASRSGTVTITGGSITRTVSVSQSGVSSPGTLDVNAITSAITVDGNLNETDWSNTTTTAIAKTLAGTPNNTANFKARWSFTHLYVGVTVTDAAEFGDSPSAPWDDDAVEIYIDGNNNKSATYGSDDRQILRIYTGSDIWTSSAIANIQHAVVNTASGYTVEIGIPWSSLGVTASTNKNVGFDAGLNDDDNGGAREHQTVWNGDGNNWSSTAAFGTIRLVGTPPSTPFLEVTPSSLSFSSSAGSNNITVSSNVSWTVTDNQSWISVSPASGSNNGTVAVSVTANAGASSRTGTVTITGSGFTRTVSVSQAEPSTSSGMVMGSNFYGDFQWSGSGQNNRLFRTGITNWAAETNPWDPTALSDIDAANYKVLRSMDWQSTNWSPLQEWSQRTKKGDNHYNAAQWQGDDIALEWMIDICNRLDMHLWVCMPHRASDDFMRKFAQALKFGTQSNGEPYTSTQTNPWSPPLKSTLKVFVEYSNETWNGTFAFRNREGQFDYVIQRGQALGLPGDDQYYKGQSFHAFRSIQMFKIFSDVFDAAPARPGLEKVYSGSGAYDWMKQALVDVFESPTHNPNGIYPTVFATAPYVGHGMNGADPNILNLFKAEVDDHLTTWGQVATFKREIVDFWNGRHPGNTMKYAAYEGGQHFWGDDQNPDNFFTNPQSYDAYMYMLEKFKPYFFVFCHFMHCSEMKSAESWGAKSYYGQPDSQAHKYRAIRDFITQNPASFREKTSPIEIPEMAYEAETTAEDKVQVYPNPVKSEIMEVVIHAEKNSEAVINLFSSSAEKVVDIKRSLTAGNNSIQISTVQLKDGLHLLMINKGNERIVKKVIIKK